VSKRLFALLAALAALGLIVAGCGASSSNGTTSASIGKAEFLKKGNAICAKGNEEIGETFENFAKEHHLSEKNPPNKAELEEVSKEVTPVIRRQLNGIRALGLPEGAEQEAEEVFEAVEEGLEEVEQNPTVLAEEEGEPFEKANELSREIGLTKCGEEE
jgi:hypothetical protein